MSNEHIELLWAEEQKKIKEKELFNEQEKILVLVSSEKIPLTTVQKILELKAEIHRLSNIIKKTMRDEES